MDTDIIHPFGEHHEWNESFYFSFYDREMDITAFMRIGLKPNKDEKSLFCFLMTPDGLIGLRGAEGYRDASLRVQGVEFHKVEAEKRWGLSFKGMMGKLTEDGMVPIEAEFDLRWESLNDVFDYRACVSGEKERISQKVASEHLEQFGKVIGELRIGDRRYAIDALGERDHSWGIRDWTAPRMWIWLTAQFSDRCALNVTKLTVDEGVVDAGFIHLDGKNLPVVGAGIDTIYRDNGGPERFEMVLTDDSGCEHRVFAEILREACMPFHGDGGTSVMYETLARYEFEGRVGYGIAEYLIRQ
jgi:hypothetical protein